MCFTLFSSSKFALFDHVRHLRRSAAYWLLVERLEEMGARFKLSWEHDPRTRGPMEPRSSSADLKAPTLAGQRGRTSHMPLTTFQRWKMRFSIWIWMNKGPLWIVPRPLKRLVVRSRQRRCLSSRSSRSFQGGGLSPSQGKAKLEVTALAKDRRFWGQDQKLRNKWACVSFRNWQINKSPTFAPKKQTVEHCMYSNDCND